MNDLTELLADCDARGIRLVPAGNGGLTIDAPRSALTSDLLGLLKTDKGELLALLRPAPEGAKPDAKGSARGKAVKPVCRCGSTTWRDVLIHNGQSIRRDCGRCERFLDFPVWYVKTTLQSEQ